MFRNSLSSDFPSGCELCNRRGTAVAQEIYEVQSLLAIDDMSTTEGTGYQS
jgi:hypothetical protein